MVFVILIWLPGGLDAPDGETINLEVRPVDVTDAEAARSVPEMAALVTEGMHIGALNRALIPPK